MDNLKPVPIYNNLYDAYIGINQRFLMDPHNWVDYMENTRGVKEDLFIEIKNPDATGIDLGKLGYKKGKWSHLLRTYMNKENFQKFIKLCEKSRGVSIGFDFNRKETGNGSCMREVILTRPSRNKPWTEAKIIWRATELQKRWAADLILVHRLLEAIPNSNFKSVKFYIASAYQSGMYTIPLIEPVFGLGWDTTIHPESHRYWKVLDYRREKYYQPDSPPQKLSPALIMQELHQAYKNNEELPIITVEDCTLEEMK